MTALGRTLRVLLGLAFVLQFAAPIQAYADGGVFPTTCISKDGTFIPLANGDQVDIYCPVSGGASVFRVFDPALPDGYTFASAFAVYIIQDRKSIPVITEGGYIKASFVAQPIQPGSSYAVLYWDDQGSSWIPLKDYLVYENGSPRGFDLIPGTTDKRKVFSGVRVVTRDGQARVEVSVNFPGIFVLAQY